MGIFAPPPSPGLKFYGLVAGGGWPALFVAGARALSSITFLFVPTHHLDQYPFPVLTCFYVLQVSH